jgi:hypothetical protein
MGFVKRFVGQAIPIFRSVEFLGSTERRFFVPTAIGFPRRAQAPSRLAAGHRRRRRVSGLDGAEHGASMCRSERWFARISDGT